MNADADKPVIFAKTRDGLDLPAIDVTNPHFAIADTPEALAARRDAFMSWDRQRRWMPQFLQRLFFRQAAKRSRLVQAMFRSDSGFLDSVTTYILKLGADYLPEGFDSPIDRQIAGAPHAAFIRLRMQQVATLLAGALAEPLRARTGAPLHLINIAGGRRSTASTRSFSSTAIMRRCCAGRSSFTCSMRRQRGRRSAPMR